MFTSRFPTPRCFIDEIQTAPPEFQMRADVLESLDRNKIPYIVETENLLKVLPQADAIYMTRIQDEHDKVSGESGKTDISNFRIRMEDMKKVKPNAIILHPFPRRDEIDVAVDSDPRAMYWHQERNGMWARAGLIAYIFNVHTEIMDY